MGTITKENENRYPYWIITLGSPIDIVWISDIKDINEALNMLYHDVRERNYTEYYLTVDQYKNRPPSDPDEKQEYYAYKKGDETTEPGFLRVTYIDINRFGEIINHTKNNIEVIKSK